MQVLEINVGTENSPLYTYRYSADFCFFMFYLPIKLNTISIALIPISSILGLTGVHNLSRIEETNMELTVANAQATIMSYLIYFAAFFILIIPSIITFTKSLIA